MVSPITTGEDGAKGLAAPLPARLFTRQAEGVILEISGGLTFTHSTSATTVFSMGESGEARTR